jgi:thiamine-phosphate pyrophosphorylase
VFELLLITDPAAPRGLAGSVRAALEGLSPEHAARIAVQLRAKTYARDALLPIARDLRQLTADAGVKLVINADLELAREIGADGVHLPESGPQPSAARAQLGAAALIGASCHDPAGLMRAAEGGADYATLSPVFESPGKGTPLGLAKFAKWVERASLPVIALGGVSSKYASDSKRAGASGLAVISAVFGAEDPAAAVRDLLNAWSR